MHGLRIFFFLTLIVKIMGVAYQRVWLIHGTCLPRPWSFTVHHCYAFQTVALLTNLRGAENCPGPFLIVCPLSVLQNWKSEFLR